jgi:hypothetical protein
VSGCPRQVAHPKHWQVVTPSLLQQSLVTQKGHSFCSHTHALGSAGAGEEPGAGEAAGEEEVGAGEEASAAGDEAGAGEEAGDEAGDGT